MVSCLWWSLLLSLLWSLLWSLALVNCLLWSSAMVDTRKLFFVVVIVMVDTRYGTLFTAERLVVSCLLLVTITALTTMVNIVVLATANNSYHQLLFNKSSTNQRTRNCHFKLLYLAAALRSFLHRCQSPAWPVLLVLNV